MVILTPERSSVSHCAAYIVRIKRQAPFDVVVHQEGDGQFVNSLDLLRRAHRKEERAAEGSEASFRVGNPLLELRFILAAAT